MIIITKQLEQEMLRLFPAELRKLLLGTGQSLEKLLAMLPLLSEAQLRQWGMETRLFEAFKNKHRVIFANDRVPKLQFTYGLKPPKRRPTSLRLARKSAIDSQRIPERYSLVDRFGSVRDQGTFGACVGFTMSAIVESATNWELALSDLFAYWASKQIDLDDDEGSSLESGQEAVRKIGICEGSLWEYNPESLQDGPSRDALLDAEHRRGKSFVDLASTSVEELEALISGVLVGSPRAVACGIPVFRISWENNYTQETGEVFDVLPGDTILGYHAIPLVGYDRASESFIFRNSWGDNWAPNSAYGPGYGTISYHYIAEYGWGFAAVSTMIQTEKQLVVFETPTTERITVREHHMKSGILDLSGASSPHVVVIGQTGAGKTSCIKTLIAENSANANFLLPDFHSDYSNDESFLESTDAIVLDIIENGLPFNILDLPLDDDLKRPIPRSLHIASIRNSLKLAFTNLGNRQLALLSEALGLLYEGSVLNGRSTKFSHLENSLLDLAARDKEVKKIAEAVIDNLGIVFRLGLLDNKDNLSIRRLLNGGGAKVFRMKLPDASQEIKKLIAIFFLSGIFSQVKFMRRLNKPIVLVQDEFFLVKLLTELFERIVREGRKFGFSLWAISQRIDDVEALIPNAGHILIFKTLGMEEIRKVASKVSTTEAMRDFVLRTLQELNQFEAILLKDNKTFEKIRIQPFFELDQRPLFQINSL
jgi:hypothetical protein